MCDQLDVYSSETKHWCSQFGASVAALVFGKDESGDGEAGSEYTYILRSFS